MTDDASNPDEISALRAENARLRGLVGPDEPALVRRTPDKAVYLRSDLRDARFFAEHRASILRAASEGRIVDDSPDWKIPGAKSQAQREAARKAATK